jgi:hypothetical protein
MISVVTLTLVLIVAGITIRRGNSHRKRYDKIFSDALRDFYLVNEVKQENHCQNTNPHP